MLASPSQSGFHSPDAVPMDPAAFRDLVVELLAAQRPQMSVALHDDPTMLRVGDHDFALDELYAQTLALSPEEQAALIVWHFDSQLANLDIVDELESKVFADVSAGIMVQIVGLNGDAAGYPSDLVVPFSSGAGLAFVADTGIGMMYVRTRHIERWGVTLIDVLEAAMRNLDAVSAGVDFEMAIPKGGGAPLLYCDSGDGYDAARLLSRAFHGRLLGALGTKVFIGAPHRDFLAAWSDDASPAAKQNFAARMLKDSQGQPHPKTADIFVLTERGLREANEAEYAEHGRQV